MLDSLYCDSLYSGSRRCPLEHARLERGPAASQRRLDRRRPPRVLADSSGEHNRKPSPAARGARFGSWSPLLLCTHEGDGPMSVRPDVAPLALRLTRAERRLIELAAAASGGGTLSSFTRDATLAAALRVVERERAKSATTEP